MTLSETLTQAIRTVPDFPEPGIQFKDITPILADPDLLRRTVDAMVEPYFDQGITKVLGIESRGFILGGMLAERLGAGFAPVRKKGKLPSVTLAESYDLEYGSATIEIHADAVAPREKVLIHDDVIATGGTAAATARLIARMGGTLVGFSFLIELDFLKGRTVLGEVPVHAMIHF